MKLALCNEVLAAWPFEEQCARAAALGYAALELAPFTLAEDPGTLDAAQARRIRAQARAHGLAISSLHWLLVKPEGLSMVDPQAPVRERTLALLRRLIDFAAECGAQVLVHGSPRQRNPVAGQSLAQAREHLREGLARLARHAAGAGLTYCIEPLSRAETPLLNTVAEAAALVDEIGQPALRTMLDVSAAAQSEAEPIEQVLRRHLLSGHVAHVQLNDRNRRGPGQGDTDQAAVLRVLREQAYAGWMAVEPFDYHPDAMGSAAFSAGYVRGLWSQMT